MRPTTDARGVHPIAPTPFVDVGATDTDSVDRLTDFYLGWPERCCNRLPADMA